MKTDLSAFKQNDKKILEKISAKPTKEGKKKMGRTPKKPEERLTEKVMINFTKAEKEKLLSVADDKGGLPLTILIRNLLKENDWI
jgi:hypothetical protein